MSETKSMSVKFQLLNREQTELYVTSGLAITDPNLITIRNIYVDRCLEAMETLKKLVPELCLEVINVAD